MKTNNLRFKPASIAKRRWASYAAAGAATALASNDPAQAAIHYSGVVNDHFPRNSNNFREYPLDQPGDSIFFEHQDFCHEVLFNISGIVSASFRGYSGEVAYVSKLRYGRNISAGLFIDPTDAGVLAIRGTCVASNSGPWGFGGGAGYVGFRFNNGAGRQYGWAR